MCLFGFLAFQAFRRHFGEDSQRGSFRNWITNTEYRNATQEYFAARNALTVPDDISQNEIQKMVERLFVQVDSDFNIQKLQLVGAKAAPQIIAALNDDRSYKTTFPGRLHALDAKSPFERLCDLLGRICPPDAVPALVRYANHDNDHFRQYAAITLGNIGTDDCIEAMVGLLGDHSRSVRSFAMMGIERGIRCGRCTLKLLESVFPLTESLLLRQDGSRHARPPKLMLSMDRDRAVSTLLSPEHFTQQNENLHYILDALNERDVPVPHDKLLPLISAVTPLLDTYPHDYQLAAALTSYARHPDKNTRALLEELAGSQNNKVAKAAADGLIFFEGITDTSELIPSVLEESSWEALTQPQQNYYAVQTYNGEVHSGGHAQYFVNSSGSQYLDALTGLKIIGANERAFILNEVIELFGAIKPSTDNTRRREQLASFSERQYSLIDALDSRYYACNENIAVLLSAYVLNNKQHFSPAR